MTETIGLKILNSKEFESRIKTQMISKSMTMIESIIHYCEQNGLEVETAASLISPRMKSEIENEAITSRMMISKKARLPI
jgi:hypothetical protein